MVRRMAAFFKRIWSWWTYENLVFNTTTITSTSRLLTKKELAEMNKGFDDISAAMDRMSKTLGRIR